MNIGMRTTESSKAATRKPTIVKPEFRSPRPFDKLRGGAFTAPGAALDKLGPNGSAERLSVLRIDLLQRVLDLVEHLARGSLLPGVEVRPRQLLLFEREVALQQVLERGRVLRLLADPDSALQDVGAQIGVEL